MTSAPGAPMTRPSGLTLPLLLLLGLPISSLPACLVGGADDDDTTTDDDDATGDDDDATGDDDDATDGNFTQQMKIAVAAAPTVPRSLYKSSLQ